MTTKNDQLHLVDELDDDARNACSPDEAPFDNEPETEDERAVAAGAREPLVRGDVVRHEDLERELEGRRS